jgi:hypothetical protein
MRNPAAVPQLSPPEPDGVEPAPEAPRRWARIQLVLPGMGMAPPGNLPGRREDAVTPETTPGRRKRSTTRANADSAGWLSAPAAAEYLCLPSVAALYKRAERGQVPVHRWRRQFRFLRKELDALMEPGPDVASAPRVLSAPVCSVADDGGR